MKPSKIVQALRNLEKALDRLNIGDELECIEFKDHEFNTLDCITEIEGIEPIIYFKPYDTSPFVYLNKN